MNALEIADKRHDMSFYLRRCIKYHAWRSAYFAKLKAVISFLGVLFGSGVAAALVAKAPAEVAITASLIVAFCSAFDLVVGTAKRSWDHNDLKKRFFAIEIELLEIRPDLLTEEKLRDLEIRTRRIESDEPHELQLLNAMVENEIIRAMYPAEEAVKYVSKLPWPKRVTANIIDWDVSKYLAVRA